MDIINIQKKLRREDQQSWKRAGEKKVLELFHAMSERVPAYRDFLQKNQIKYQSINRIEDLNKIPTIDKDNYLRRYPLKDLCWDGIFDKGQYTISSTSGSTGKAFYFPRTSKQVEDYALLAELYLLENFEIDKKTTLYINAFPMGPWIGGVFTYEAVRLVAERGKYPISIITPGINKKEILNEIKEFGNQFEQILIGSYGPFLKDMIDEGIEQGMDFGQYNFGCIFSAEGFTEGFRDYVIEKLSLKDKYKMTLNHYGTVDLGTMAHETPISILIRRLAIKNSSLYQELFGNIHKLPTLCQYMPDLFYFESIDNRLICSADSGIPLLRYDLKDHGGIFTIENLEKKFKKFGLDLYQEMEEVGLQDSLWNLPFVYVYERSDFSVSLYAFQIYPETLKRALQNHDLHEQITGKFHMLVKYDQEQNQFLEINIELKKNQKETDQLREKIEGFIIDALLKEVSEFAETYKHNPQKMKPSIVFWPYEDQKYFKSGIKQKWSSKIN